MPYSKNPLLALSRCTSLLTLLGGIFSSVNAYGVDEEFINYDQNEIAIVNVTLIDGTGAPPKTNQAVLIKSGHIAAVDSAKDIKISQTTTVIDGTGKTLIPGLVMMHEHMFYPTGNAHYTEMLYSFPRLYLAGGATTVRTAGTTAPYGDLNLRDAINSGKTMGPDIDVTAPYLNGPGLPILKIKSLRDAQDAKNMMQYWDQEGVTSYKAYMHIHQDELAQVLSSAHQRKRKVTGHLCSITYKEAAELGIDNLEHGFFAATDFVKDKKKNQCPAAELHQSLVDLDINAPEVEALISLLVSKNVALTSTLTVFETFTHGRPKAYPLALEALIPQVREQYETRWQKIAQQENATWPIVFKKMMQLEKRFVEAGGTLMAGTDPTGYGGVIGGFSNQRQIELLVEAGFSIQQAIKIATLNGATFLERDTKIGSIEAGKQADLVLIDGELINDTSAIRDMAVVFKHGVGYNVSKIVQQTKSVVGLH
ncbi:MAG: amidohydrolase [Alteromonadaceae bacterium]|uniref:amidohydrolase family protein n=1 Tax=Paraglaciecola chathamensis TaxID=368405 RepID=UPI000C625E40|nr:amidohydrolase family protein [Paraglaciecola agarilytica]MBN25389.1 amidohydrolase [Alteromonadaceae bacterium]|tara:strand:+ start:49756 stop:51195 length:1440 start_codon:yes stop_codon:yes gene_type:complete